MLSRVASNNTEWELLTLPTRLGGLGLPCLSRMAQHEFDISVSVTTPLTSLVLEQKTSLGSAPELQQRLKAAALRQKNTNLQAFAHSVVEHLPAQGQRAVQLACEKGSSSWLNALPLVEHGFDLSKSAFRDAVALRYGWEIKNLPSTCACGAHFNPAHVWRAVCFKIPERHSFKAPERQSSEAPKRQSFRVRYALFRNFFQDGGLETHVWWFIGITTWLLR